MRTCEELLQENDALKRENEVLKRELEINRLVNSLLVKLEDAVKVEEAETAYLCSIRDAIRLQRMQSCATQHLTTS